VERCYQLVFSFTIIEMEEIVGVIGLLANMKTIIAGGGIILSLSLIGVLPKAGLGRAIIVHYKSFFAKASPLSVRVKEIAELKHKIDVLQPSHYILVTGGKGLGKSCLINTALHRRCGVIKIRVSFFLFIHFSIYV